MKKNIAIIFGGCSPEYEVSLKSAHSVLEHINTNKYDVIPIGITKDGQWFRYYGGLTSILQDTWHKETTYCKRAFISPDRSVHGLGELTAKGLRFTYLDAVFPVLHGGNGEDGSLQGLLQLAGIPFVGCKTLSSALCMDKHRAHQLVCQAGIKVPKSVYFHSRPTCETLFSAVEGLGYPLYVKPLRCGSSFGVTKVNEVGELLDAVNTAFSFDHEILIEEQVPGSEVGCAILGSDSDLTIGRVDEIELSCDFFDYNEKYTQAHSHIHMPARIDGQTESRIKTAAEKVYQTLGCSGLARIDFFLTPEGDIYFNEVNTMPGFTNCSRYPAMLSGIGMDYSEVIEKLIELC